MAELLKVLCWLWHQPGGRTYYSDAHVRIWADMVRRNLSLPHTLAVVTDLPGDYGGIEVIKPPGDFEDVTIPTWTRGRPQCHRRLSMFRPDAAQLFGADRLVQMDLDVVVTDSLDPLLDLEDDFRIARGTSSSRSYNGSLWLIRCGARPRVFTEFTRDRAVAAGRKHVGSDQSWLHHILGSKERTWGVEAGVVSWHSRQSVPAPRLVTFPGALKPWRLAELGSDATVSQHYRRSPSGRALVLGYGPTLWADVARVMAVGERFRTVIAAPEAAKHWPDPMVMIADDDEHAERLAAMHGLEPVWCGRTTGGADALAA